MQHVIVRTKLQSIIVRRLLDEGVVRRPFHLIHVLNSNEPSTTHYISGLAAIAEKITVKSRPKHGFLSMSAYFLWLMSRCRLRNEAIFVANVNWYHFGLALKFFPGLRLNTFDDGTANIQKSSTFFDDTVLDLESFGGRIAQWIFPGGVARFVRQRIVKHYTIYPGVENIVERSRIVAVPIEWSDLIEPGDLARLPSHVRKILVGTVYAEAYKVWKMDFTEHQVLEAIAWSDLYLPHPRQPHDAPANEVISKYPAEALISHYAGRNELVVAHFNSSAVVHFLSDPRIRLIDLSRNEKLIEALSPAN